MAKRLLLEKAIEKVTDAFKSLSASHREATLDQLGELVVSEKEADHYQDEVLKLISGLKEHYPLVQKMGRNSKESCVYQSERTL